VSISRFLRVAPLFLISAVGQGQNGTAPIAAATRARTAPVIDGNLGDEAWIGPGGIDSLLQREPFEGRPASERTRVRFLFDDEALYVGAWLFDRDPSSIVVGQNLRDVSLTDSDAFLVVLDTYLDRQNGFVFGTTPGGIEYDGQVSNEGQGGSAGQNRQQAGTASGFNLNWDGSWGVATTRDANGWYAEMRIPFSSLRYGKGGPQTWGLNIERRIRRNNELAVWAPLPRQFEIFRVSLAGTLTLEAPARRTITVSPYALSENFRDLTSSPASNDYSIRTGGDAKVGLTQSLTLDLTANTDFALAEVDDQQVNLTRFSLFFPEKRAFFLENAASFGVGASRSAEMFFSRRIGLAAGREVPILGGARLTGKVGNVQLGLLSIQTDDLTEPVSSGTIDTLAPSNNFSVLRVYREFTNRSRIGGIAVSRVNTSDAGDRNLAVGVDGRLGLGQDLTLDGWIGLTRTPLHGATAAGGWNAGEYAYGLSGLYSTRLWQISAGYREVGEAFNPEVGFVNRWAYRHGNARISHNLRTPGVPWFREFRPHVSWNQFWSLDGFSESYLVHFDTHFAFANGAFFQLPGFNLSGEGLAEPFEIRPGIVIPAGSYNNMDWEFRANTNRAAPLSITGGWDLGGFYNGTRFGPLATVVWRYRDVLSATFRANYFDVRLPQGRFTTAVYGLNASWSLTPRVYVQGNVQYNDDTRNLASNVRLGWLDRAGTGFFIVFNDAWHRGPFDRTGILAGPQQRQLVVKYSRLVDVMR
jgi:hypothetical protein